MNIIKVIISSLISVVSLFTIAKLLGKRQIAQLSLFDYVASVTLGSIAAELAILSDDSIIEPLIAMFIFGATSYGISYITCKSYRLRLFFEGHVILLYQDGQIFEKNLLRAKIDVNEFLSACRASGYFDLEKVHTVYLETNGQISIYPMAKNKPASPEDLNLVVKQNKPFPNVIIDGRILKEAKEYIQKNDKWIDGQLKSNGIKDIKEVMLATYDFNKDKLNIYRKFHKAVKRDI